MKNIANYISSGVKYITAVENSDYYKRIEATITCEVLQNNILFIKNGAETTLVMTDQFLCSLLHVKMTKLRFWYRKEECSRKGVHLSGLQACTFVQHIKSYNKLNLGEKEEVYLYAYDDVIDIIKNIEGNNKNSLSLEDKNALNSIRQMVKKAFVDANSSPHQDTYILNSQNMATNIYKGCNIAEGDNATVITGNHNNGVGGQNNQNQSGTGNNAEKNEAGGDVNNSQTLLDSIWQFISKALKRCFIK